VHTSNYCNILVPEDLLQAYSTRQYCTPEEGPPGLKRCNSSFRHTVLDSTVCPKKVLWDRNIANSLMMFCALKDCSDHSLANTLF